MRMSTLFGAENFRNLWCVRTDKGDRFFATYYGRPLNLTLQTSINRAKNAANVISLQMLVFGSSTVSVTTVAGCPIVAFQQLTGWMTTLF